MTIMTRTLSRLVVASLLGGILSSVPLAAQTDPPRLVVVLAVDQMRADYLDRFGHQWSDGLRRLVDEGAIFTNAAYSYFGTLTCAGHATIATGTVPATHGIVLDGWWDPEAGRRIRCTADPTADVVRYGPRGRGGHGPGTIRVPTLSDEMRTQLGTPPRIAAFALKGRAAVMLAGHAADAVAWFDDGSSWTSSTAYGAEPVPFLSTFVAANPVEDDRGKTWGPSQSPEAYLYRADPSHGEAAAAGAPLFSHTLASSDEDPDTAYYTSWITSPFADEYVERMAEAAIEALELGQGDRTDYLAIGFSSADYVGHEFGPRSLEVQEHFIRLDATLGRLFRRLDAVVGRDRYVVALSADHGVAPIPEWAVTQGFDAGRIDRGEVVRRVNEALVPVLGPGEHAASMTHIEFYFAPGVYDRLRTEPEAMATALEAIRTTPGVATVFRSEEIARLARDAMADPLTRRVAASYVPGRSGDLVVIPKPYWYTWIRGADHGTGYDYDTRVPLVLMGAGVRAGRYHTSADPADIAPTLGRLINVTLAHPDGRVLTEALVQ